MARLAVGQDQAIGSEDEPRTASMRLAFTAATSHPLSDFDVHYRRAYALGRAYYRPGVGVEQGGVVRIRQGSSRGNVSRVPVQQGDVVDRFQVHGVEMLEGDGRIQRPVAAGGEHTL